jgi:hypothetical protein
LAPFWTRAFDQLAGRFELGERHTTGQLWASKLRAKRQRPITRRLRLALLDTMGAILPTGVVALVSFAPFSGADAALVAAVLTVATYCMVFR